MVNAGSSSTFIVARLRAAGCVFAEDEVGSRPGDASVYDIGSL